MIGPEVVPADKWQQARDELLREEKELTRRLDALAARRRRLPMVTMEASYTFDTAAGFRSLPELFDGHDQLIAYQFMDVGPDGFCPGCTAFTDNVPVAAPGRLAGLGVAWVTVSDMPLAQLQGYAAARHWNLPLASSRGTSFSTDCGAGGGFMLSTFLRDGDQVYRTYSSTSRGVDRLLFVNNVLYVTVFGRQEDWEDSPAGWPQHPTYG